MSLSYNYPPQMAYPSSPPVYRGLPAPPRLHWAILLVLSILTIGIFGMIWMVVQSHWVKKVTKNGRPFVWCLTYALMIPAAFVLAFGGVILLTLVHAQEAVTVFTSLLGLVIQIGGFVLYLVAAYTLKGALEAEPIDIPLSGIMTFFFCTVYFQYHLYDYSVEGRVAEQLTGFPEPAVAPVANVDAETSPQS